MILPSLKRRKGSYTESNSPEEKEWPEGVPREELSGVQMGGPIGRDIPPRQMQLIYLGVPDPVKDFLGGGGIIMGMSELSMRLRMWICELMAIWVSLLLLHDECNTFLIPMNQEVNAGEVMNSTYDS